MSDWATTVSGKCILVGEHAVLRGVPALVVPLKTCTLNLKYDDTESDFRVDGADPQSETTKVVLWGVIEKALREMGKSDRALRGTLTVKNSIPFGAGLGASAALCVGLARFFLHLGWVKASDTIEFARTLEDIFHGESSGVDVAVAEIGKPLKFQRGAGIHELKPIWTPQLYLSFSGHKGVTSDCVQKVKALRDTNPLLAEELDQMMRMAVGRFEEALVDESYSADDRHQLVASALELARKCFEKWGLTSGSLDTQMSLLIKNGAVAVKPTGSGGGGHVLSLWKTPPISTGELSEITFIPVQF